jgi:hypothetical protein
MSETGFTTMAGAKSESAAPEIGVGMMGYAFMGKAHSNAFKKLPYMMYPPVAIPKLVAIAGRDEAAVQEAAARYGYAKYYTDWHDLLKDDDVQLFDNGAPNDAHAEPCIEAAKAGKHILCEKPLARTARCCHQSRSQTRGCLQLPVCSRRPAGERPDHGRETWTNLSLPRGLSAGVDHASLWNTAHLAAEQKRGGERCTGRSGGAYH